MTKRLVAGLATGAVLVMLAGCGEESNGQAEPAPEAPVESSEAAPESDVADGSAELPHSGAPVVSNPLPDSVLEGAPCDVLAPDEVEMILGAQAEGAHSDLDEVGPGCRWSNPGQGSSVQVRFHTVQKEGLSANYAHTPQQVEHFEEIDPVGGFPAVEFGDAGGETGCQVVVGLSDEYSVGVDGVPGYDAANSGTDSCEVAAKVAEVVVENLKNNAGG
ncbi:DUF3558 domain-containing protein [Saccharomonospora sp. CUA-673]|uniref:DUF3558 domain-containing protein n=1 Tax=Saccharomonospora sp. CUA-673 TaxID=1904969 RepID=UPI0021006F07|nr:DUF3558 domain-containing protein [Saccharomonospora sp. CUA-673]